MTYFYSTLRNESGCVHIIGIIKIIKQMAWLFEQILNSNKPPDTIIVMKAHILDLQFK